MYLEARILAHFRSTYGLGEPAALRMLGTCRASLRDGMELLAAAISAVDTFKTAQQAHSLKGTLLSAGLFDLAETARVIETEAFEGGSSQALPGLEILKESLAEFLCEAFGTRPS